jgi:regulator of sigma E protease
MLALQLMTSLSILVLLHELGHFIPAKLFKTRVEKFYLFFDPWFSLFKTKKGDTEYGIGWLPLGGYVKISGMVDESMDKDQLNQPAQPWEFRSKPAWQRLIIMVGGVVVNVLLGMVLYAMVLGVWGKDQLPVQNLTYGVHCDSLMQSIGFEEGDRIVALDGNTPDNYLDIPKFLLLNQPHSASVIRDGKQVEINLPENLGQQMVDGGVKMPITPRIPCVVDSVAPGNAAFEAGMLKKDSICRINRDTVVFFGDVQKKLKSLAGQSIVLGVMRKGELVELAMNVSQEGTIGFFPQGPAHYFQFVNKKYGFFEAIPAGIAQAWQTIVDYVDQLKYIFTKSGAKSVGGFGTFAKLFPEEWDWAMFWERTAFISLILAFMNILPIPALDGGHVVFLLWEMATGKPAPQKILEVAQMIGMILLLGLMLYGNGMDIFRWLSSN